MSDPTKPNVSIPLACSYNERGLTGFTTTVTDGLDQRKINSIYEPVSNAMTGQQTLYLAKRPGVDIADASLGTTGQVGYLTSRKPGATLIDISNVWVFSTSGSDIRASDTSTTTVIAAAAGYAPAYVDFTAVSAVDTLVVQLRNASFAQTVWYSTAIATFTQITDSVFAGLTLCGKMEFLDGYALAFANTNRIYNSDLNSLALWRSTQYITKQIVQDIPQGLARIGSQIIAFGEETMEVFVNAGNATGSPLKTVKELSQRVGLKSPSVVGQTHYYATYGGKLYFVGREGGTLGGGVFVYNGSRAEKISTLYIDKILRERQHYSVNTIAFDGKVAIAIALDLTTATTQRWLMFFPAWNDWFEWTSPVYTPVNSGRFHLGVGVNQHKLYTFTMDWQDDTTDFTWTHQFKLPSSGNHRKFMPMCGVVGDTARAASSLNVSFSDDDYQTFSTARAIDMTSAEKMLTRCGSYKTARAVRLTHTGNLDVRLEKFIARVNE